MEMDQQNDYEPFIFYSTTQERVLSYLPLLTAPFSAVGSALVIYTILWKDHRKTLKSPYHRMVLGMSLLDLCSSLGMLFLGAWTSPTEAVDYVPGAKGTFATCAVSGFFLNLLFGTMWYSAFLSLYFLLVVGLGCRDETPWVKFLEPTGHAFAWLLPVLTGSIGAAAGSFNPMSILPGFCWFWRYPPECDYTVTDTEDPAHCTRGLRLINLSVIANVYFMIAIFVIVATSMIVITVKVRRIEKRLQRYAGGSLNSLERTKATGVQSLLYIGAFFLTFGPIAMTSILYQHRDEQFYFVFAVLTKLLSPLQGFWNFWIYIRNRSHRRSRASDTQSCCRPFSNWIHNESRATSSSTKTHPVEDEEQFNRSMTKAKDVQEGEGDFVLDSVEKAPQL